MWKVMLTLSSIIFIESLADVNSYSNHTHHNSKKMHKILGSHLRPRNATNWTTDDSHFLLDDDETFLIDDSQEAQDHTHRVTKKLLPRKAKRGLPFFKFDKEEKTQKDELNDSLNEDSSEEELTPENTTRTRTNYLFSKGTSKSSITKKSTKILKRITTKPSTSKTTSVMATSKPKMKYLIQQWDQPLEFVRHNLDDINSRYSIKEQHVYTLL